MKFAMILTESEYSEMLEPLFHEVGHHEGIKLCDTELDNRALWYQKYHGEFCHCFHRPLWRQETRPCLYRGYRRTAPV